MIFPSVPKALLHVFQLLAAVAIIYLACVCIRRIKQKQAMSDYRVHLLVVTLVTALFHAAVTGHKEIYYMAHLVPWFALAAAVMLGDAQDMIGGLRRKPWPQAHLIYNAALVVTLVAVLTYGVMLVRQYSKYYQGLRNPGLVTFDEYETTLRELIPDALCPVVRKISPAVWLAFPEKDGCFADIENRMRKAVDIDGKDYALLTPDSRPEYHLLGELTDTAYGPVIRVYYTGTDARFTALPPRVFRFFNWQFGHVEEPPDSGSRQPQGVSAFAPHLHADIGLNHARFAARGAQPEVNVCREQEAHGDQCPVIERKTHFRHREKARLAGS